MEKKILSRLSILLFSSVLLVGCGNQTADTSTDTDQTEDTEAIAEEKIVTVGVYVDGELLEGSDKEISIEEDQDIMQIMEEHYDIETTEDGFMTAIEGYEEDESENQYWLYYVNEEMLSVGAEDYVPELEDDIEWRLE